MRRSAILWVLLVCLALSGCGEKDFSGRILEVQRDGGAVTALVIRTEEGKDVGLRLAKNTVLWPMESGSVAENFNREAVPGTEVWAECAGGRQALSWSGGAVDSWAAEHIRILEVDTGERVTLRDGTELAVYHSDFRDYTYRAPDGTALLRENGRSGPDNVMVGDWYGFAELDEAARSVVTSWYEDRGPLYDIEYELERVWQAYTEAGRPADFQRWWLEQSVSPSAVAEDVVYFQTSLIYPMGKNAEGESIVEELTTGQAFDRHTGELLNNWDLFTQPPAEVARQLVEKEVYNESPDLRQAMVKALEAEDLVFSDKWVSMHFRPEELGTEYAHLVSVEVQDLEGLIQPWAMPIPRG